MATDCSCGLVALRSLMRLEQLDGVAVPLDRSLELAERAEADCQALLQCETCRQQSFALFSVTALSACVVDWLRRSWRLDGCDDSVHHPLQISLGDYNLESADAEILGRELMALRLSNLVKVVASLETTVATLGTAQAGACLDVVQSNLQQLRDCVQRVRDISSAST